MVKILILIMMLVCQVNLAVVHASTTKHEFHHPQQFVDKIKGNKNSGQLIYQQFCQLCHSENPAVNVGAPTIGQAEAWRLRMKKGLDGMLSAIDAGMNAMPPRGGCFECSDDQLKAAIKYMLPKKAASK